ncbi:MAG: PilZ domain-containing protein [Deltaproteobacteria bacterium]|jgi:hypothetical protein|nr:PilZ domain-containing protein [Deltaproteobacteria bacterium]
MANDSLYDVLDFYIEQHSTHRRGSYRVAVRGLTLYLDDIAQAFDIRDLSSSGCSLRAQAALLAVGRIVNGNLHIGNTGYLMGLTIKVIRHIADDSVACVFQALSRRQEIMLDKLLLEIQKRSIATHTARRKRKKH